MNRQVKGKIFTQIISGGQTGVDRAALDVAIALGLKAGGWCPRGRRAEDGKIPDRYPLRETGSWRYPVRTRRNVLESDGTLILTRGEPRAGTALTAVLAERLKKPFFLVDFEAPEEGRESFWLWGRLQTIRVLNVAGPRESETPGIYDQAARFLKKLLSVPQGGGGAGNTLER
jgi:hypothetical protein